MGHTTGPKSDPAAGHGGPPVHLLHPRNLPPHRPPPHCHRDIHQPQPQGQGHPSEIFGMIFRKVNGNIYLKQYSIGYFHFLLSGFTVSKHKHVSVVYAVYCISYSDKEKI